MKKQSRNQKCKCGSNLKYKYCCGNLESGKRTTSDMFEKNECESNIKAEHITYLGNNVVRNSSQIYPSTVQHFKQFQLISGTIKAKIELTPFDCIVTTQDGIGIFSLIRNGTELTRTICCFGQNRDLALDFIQKTIEEISTTHIGSNYNKVLGLRSSKPTLNNWLYTFITNIMTPSEAILSGEIEFYVYDAIRRGISYNNPSIQII